MRFYWFGYNSVNLGEQQPTSPDSTGIFQNIEDSLATVITNDLGPEFTLWDFFGNLITVLCSCILLADYPVLVEDYKPIMFNILTEMANSGYIDHNAEWGMS